MMQRAITHLSPTAIFSSEMWFDTWMRTLGNSPEVQPCWIEVTRVSNDVPAMTLPLVAIRTNGMTNIAFCDRDVTDYNGGWVGEGAPATRLEMQSAWAAIVRALPGHDLIHLEKLPSHVPGTPCETLGQGDVHDQNQHAVPDCGSVSSVTQAQPLSFLSHKSSMRLSGHALVMPDDYDVHLRSLTKKVRKELARSGRLFEKIDGARFVAITDPSAAQDAYTALGALQKERIEQLGLPYKLDQPEYDAFYEELTKQGVGKGEVVLTALKVGDEFAAVLFGICNDNSYAMVRLAHAGDTFGRFGPGRLIIERTMRHLHEHGVRHIDFTTGDYPYKHRFGVSRVPLFEIYQGASVKGKYIAARQRAKAYLRRFPVLDKLRQRISG